MLFYNINDERYFFLLPLLLRSHFCLIMLQPSSYILSYGYSVLHRVLLSEHYVLTESAVQEYCILSPPLPLMATGVNQDSNNKNYYQGIFTLQ